MADVQEAFVAAKPVQEAVGVGLSERELHDVSAEHGFGRVTWVTAVLVGRFENLNERAGA